MSLRMCVIPGDLIQFGGCTQLVYQQGSVKPDARYDEIARVLRVFTLAGPFLSVAIDRSRTLWTSET